MLERMQIENFQTHQLRRVKFSRRITTFIGPTDSGKSSLLRALQWVSLNRPRGDSHIYWDANFCQVRLWVDGQAVERRRDRSGNTYRLGEQQWRAFGQEVPPEVASLLNMGEMNFQGQHDAPFWVSLSASELAKSLNQIVDLGIIDSHAAALGLRLRRGQDRLTAARSDVQEAEKRVERLAWVPAMEAKLTKLEEGEGKISTLECERSTLRYLYHKCRDGIQAARQWRRVAERGRKAVEFAEAMSRLQAEVNDLRHYSQQLQEAERIAERKPPSLAQVDRVRERWREARDQCLALRSLLERLDQAREQLTLAHIDVAEARRKLERECNGICPVCGGELK